MSHLLTLFGGSVDNTIGGVAIGAAGETGTIYEGYVLAAGEEFRTLDLLTAARPEGKYIPSHRRRGRRAINSGANDYYWSPEHTGYNDVNRGIAIGSGVSDLLYVSDSALKLSTRLSTTNEKNLAWETTASTGPQRPQSSAALHSAGYQAVKYPCVIEARLKMPTGAQLPAAGWPAFWTENVLPTWANTGEFDFEWIDNGNLYCNFITGSSVNDSISTTVVDTADGLWHTFSMVVTAATIKFYKDGVLMITAVKRPDVAVTGPMFWWFRIGVDLTPGIFGMTYSAAAWSGVTATMEVDYVRLWTGTSATNLGYKGLVSTNNVDFSGSLSTTLPSKATLWGGATVTEYLIFQPIESAEPGISEVPLTGAPNTWYGQTSATNSLWGPSFLAWNPTTRALTGSGFDQAGRLVGHIVAWDDTNGGLAGFARVVINVGPNITTTDLSATQDSVYSKDIYAECDCGMLTTNSSGECAKIIDVTGLPDGLSFDPDTSIISGTPTGTGTTEITIEVTNSIGQTASKAIDIVVSSAGAAPTIDPSGAVTITAPSTNPATITLSTTNSDDIICVICNPGGAGSVAVTGVTNTAGLTWYKAAGTQYNSSGNSHELWWAYSPSPLSSDVITVTSSGSGIGYRLTAFGISGADTSNPIDGNANAALSSTGTTAQTLTEVVSTNSANTLLIASARSTASLGTVTPPSGSTQLINAGANQHVSYQAYSSALSSENITYSWTGATTASAMLAVAFKGA